MKKKLLSMMTLLLCAVLGMQAQTTIYSWEGGADGATETGGTAAWVNGTGDASRLNYKNGDYYTMCLNGKKANVNDTEASNNASKMVITLDQAVAEGDEIAFTAYINKNESKKASAYILFENGAAIEGEVFSDESNIDPAFGNPPTTKTTTVTAAAAGSKTITLTRSQAGTNLFITKLVITRAGGGSDEAKPAITFEAGAAERTVSVTLSAIGKKASIDWGDGTKEELEAVADSWGDVSDIEFTGTPKGTVKVYGDDIVGFTSYTAMTDGVVVDGITSIDVSNASALTNLDVHNNLLTTIDLTKNVALKLIDVSANKLTAVDFSANTAATKVQMMNNAITTFKVASSVTDLRVSNNPLGTLDLTPYTNIKSLYALNCELTEVNLGTSNVAKPYFSLNNNKLTKVDASKQTELSNGSLFLMNNNLTELLLPEKVKTVNITDNRFDLASLYALTTSSAITTLTAAKMQDYVIAETINGSIDLSSQATVGDKASTIKWYAEDGTELVEGTDYTAEAGVYTFIKEQAGKVYATLLNADALPKLTTAIKTTQATVTVATGISTAKAEGAKAMIFNLAGQRLDAPAKGLNIIGGKKVMVK